MTERFVQWAAAVDVLYREVLESPDSFDDERLAEWLGEVGSDTPPPKPVAKELRRAMRVAKKLRDLRPDRIDPDWRRTVDELVGIAAWRPALGIVQYGFEEEPTRALFDDLKVRLRDVTFDRWMEGVDFDTWSAGTERTS